MPKIVEKIIEPNKIEVGSFFKLKIKVEDKYFSKRRLISEDNRYLITEDNKFIKTEWGG